MTAMRWISTASFAGAIVAGAAWWLQRETTAALRSEIALLHEEQRTLAGLRAEHERLLASQVPEAELARLRSDHAALLRLRGEIEQLQARAGQSGRAPREPATAGRP